MKEYFIPLNNEDPPIKLIFAYNEEAMVFKISPLSLEYILETELITREITSGSPACKMFLSDG